MKLIHQELHRGSFYLSDVILGGQDGLVNVLGVILGIAAAGADQRIVIAGGLAASFAESVSMAAVAFTSTLADADYYAAERQREITEIETVPEIEREEIRTIYKKRGFQGKLLEDVVATITSNKEVWLETMMNEELQLQPVAKQSAFRSGVIVGLSAIVGSFIPLTPFFLMPMSTAVVTSLVISTIALFIVGAYKAKITVGHWYKSGLQMTIIGMLSALVGYGIGLLFKAPVAP